MELGLGAAHDTGALSGVAGGRVAIPWLAIWLGLVVCVIFDWAALQNPISMALLRVQLGVHIQAFVWDGESQCGG